jgi:beta-glucuronidase
VSAQAQDGGGAPPPAANPAPPPQPAPRLIVGRPERRVLIREGQDRRYLLGGRWYFRLDDGFVGDSQRLFAQRSLDGWTAIRVPHAWNAQDRTTNRSSIGWYRKEFTVPGGRRHRWIARFEGASHRSVVWLNGRKIGGFNGGGYFPFEVDLTGLRRGRNTLVVKVSNLRSNTDLTHWRPAAFNGYGTGGWWNHGGLIREVYLRRVEHVDIENVRVLPRLRCVRCDARVGVAIKVRNLTRRDRKVELALNAAGQRVELTPRGVAGRGGSRELRTSFVIRRPRLWQPGRPALYRMTVGAGLDGRRLSTYRLAFGVRRLEAARGGRLLLNGRQLRLRGASIHEDHPDTGAALTPRQRSQFVSRLRQVGGTVSRAHYPLHPAFLEAFDRLGILYWSQAPVYQSPGEYFERAAFRRTAIDQNRRVVYHNANHPSIFVWSIGNELAGERGELGRIGPGLGTFIRDASEEVRRLDPTRLVGIDRQSRIGEPIFNRALAGLDVLGVNEYFGWYESVLASMDRPPSRTDELSAFLDQIHAAYPNKPLVVTEYGAEATRSGPREQKGTFEFQNDFMRQHLAIHASKRYVNGSIAWALRDFRVEPTWLGGAPREYATPPWHNKSLVEEWNAPKPVFRLMQSRWRRTRPLR